MLDVFELFIENIEDLSRMYIEQCTGDFNEQFNKGRSDAAETILVLARNAFSEMKGVTNE